MKLLIMQEAILSQKAMIHRKRNLLENPRIADAAGERTEEGSPWVRPVSCQCLF